MVEYVADNAYLFAGAVSRIDSEVDSMFCVVVTNIPFDCNVTAALYQYAIFVTYVSVSSCVMTVVRSKYVLPVVT